MASSSQPGDEPVPEGVWAAAPPAHRADLLEFRDRANRYRKATSIFTKVVLGGIALLVLGVLCSLFGSFSDSSSDPTQVTLDAGPSAWTTVARWLYVAGGAVFVVGIVGAIFVGVRGRQPLPEFTRDYVTLLDGAPGTSTAVELQEERARVLENPASQEEQAADAAIGDLIEDVGRTQQELQRTSNMDESATKMAELDVLIERMSDTLSTMREHGSDAGLWQQVVRSCRE